MTVEAETPLWRSKWIYRAILATALGTMLFLALHDVGMGRPGIISVASAESNGLTCYKHAYKPSISAEGRYVAFYTGAWMTSADKNSYDDVYVKDTRTGSLTLVSTDSSGGNGNGDSSNPSISGDGRYVAFESAATNLAVGDNNGKLDVFVKDIQTNQTYRASVNSWWIEGNDESKYPSISADGRYVAFVSDATNLVNGDTNNVNDIFVRDLTGNSTVRVSTSSTGAQGNGYSYEPFISSTGRYVTFQSASSNLAGGDTNGQGDIFLKDTATGSMTRASTGSTGLQANQVSEEASVTPDGKYVIFRSWADNLVAGDTNKGWDVFIKEVQTGALTRVSTGASGGQADNNSWDPGISSDGRYITFSSTASNLVSGDTNNLQDIFVKDLYSGEVTRLSTSYDGTQANNHCGENVISSDGRFVAFETDATNLAALDFNTRNIYTAPVGRQYFFSWYDNIYSADWILMANKAAASKSAWFDVFIAGLERDPGSVSGGSSGQVPAGNILTPRYNNLMGGPVNIGSLTGSKALVSQRILWKGKSFEEVIGVEASQLSDRYYWTWYDQHSAGMQNWIMIANPSANPVYYEIRIGGVLRHSGTIGSVSYVTPQFPGLSGGPVEVRAWSSSNKTAPAAVVASQRVLSGNGNCFNEVMGTPASSLSDHYVWTWYDQLSPGAMNWVLVANQNSSSVYYEIKIYGTVYTSGTLNPGQMVTPSFPGLKAGPVEVQAWTSSGKSAPADIIASQRVLWGASFDETPGYPVSDLNSSYHWTWYDQQSAGSQNWIMIFNPNMSQIYYEIYVAGAYQAGGYIDGGQSITPQLAGVMGGPVEVRAWAGAGKTSPVNIFASQRVLWGSYFNETPGVVLD